MLRSITWEQKGTKNFPVRWRPHWNILHLICVNQTQKLKHLQNKKAEGLIIALIDVSAELKAQLRVIFAHNQHKLNQLVKN